MSWHATILTIFPELFPGPLGSSVVGRALDKGLWNLDTVNIRDFAHNNYNSVDDTPYGGGAGMVMRADIVGKAIDSVIETDKAKRKIYYLSPRGKRLDQIKVKTIANSCGAVILCGRYEGIDQRIIDEYQIEEISLGDFILSGGEYAAYCLIDACVRLQPNVLGKVESFEDESFENGLLEYPHYTRPDRWKERDVPDVLRTGHHQKIKDWRLEQSKQITRNVRPDLWDEYKKLNNEK